jgi:hypothetical protein
MARRVGKNVIAIACLAGAIGLSGAVIWLTPASQAGPCTVLHDSALRELPEASGLAISRRHPGIIWSHNDSGHRSELFALDATGAVRARVRVPIATDDWEDVSAGRCPSGDCLYIGDIGNNRLARSRVRIYRVPEPALNDTETAAAEVFTASYADGPHNAEALFILGDKIFVAPRDRGSAGVLYRATLPAAAGTEMTFERVGQLGLAPVTDAEATPDETSVVVRTSKLAIIYRAADLIRGGAEPGGLRIPLEGLKEPQGEGVALDNHGALYLASEGRPWTRGGRLISLQCGFK